MSVALEAFAFPSALLLTAYESLLQVHEGGVRLAYLPWCLRLTPWQQPPCCQGSWSHPLSMAEIIMCATLS